MSPWVGLPAIAVAISAALVGIVLVYAVTPQRKPARPKFTALHHALRPSHNGTRASTTRCLASTTPSSLPNVGREKEDVRAELLSLVQSDLESAQRGSTATIEDKRRVDSLVSTLCSGRSVDMQQTASLLPGRWQLLYTSRPNTGVEDVEWFQYIARAAPSPIQRFVVGATAQAGLIYQDIDEQITRFSNVIDFGESGQLHIIAAIESIKDGHNLMIKFCEGYFDLLDVKLPLIGELVSNKRLPYPVPFRLLPESRGSLDTLYIDDTMRISRGNLGTVFILRRISTLASTSSDSPTIPTSISVPPQTSQQQRYQQGRPRQGRPFRLAPSRLSTTALAASRLDDVDSMGLAEDWTQGWMDDYKARPVLLLADLAGILLFAAVGRGSHHETVDALGVLATAFPFLLGYFAFASRLGAYAQDATSSFRRGLHCLGPAWLVGTASGVFLRALLRMQAPPVPFIIATSIFTLVFLAIPRAALVLFSSAGDSQDAPVTNDYSEFGASGSQAAGGGPDPSDEDEKGSDVNLVVGGGLLSNEGWVLTVGALVLVIGLATFTALNTPPVPPG